MVDAEDLKSFDHCDRVGSSPTIPTTLRPVGFGWQATLRGTMRVVGHSSRNNASGIAVF